MANPTPDPNWSGAQKDAYARQYGGWWSGSTYMPTGTAPAAAPKPAVPTAAPIAAPATTAPVSTSTSQRTTTGSIVPAGLGTTATTPRVAGGPTIQTSFRDALLKQLAVDPNAVTLRDPMLAPQMQAYNDQQQRALAQAQQSAAEQAFQGGALGTGAYRNELATQRQQAGEQASQFGAGLLGQARNQRAAELFQSLGLANQLLGQGEDTQLRQTALGAQTRLGEGQLGLGLLQALLGDENTKARLGFDIGSFGANLNTNTLLKLAGLG